MVDVSAECEVEKLNKAKEEVKKAKIAVDMHSLYERLKKSVISLKHQTTLTFQIAIFKL